MSERIVYSDGFLPPVSAGTRCTVEEGKTVQSEALMADINAIVRRYETTGTLPLDQRQGVFADISEMVSFAEALQQVNRVSEYFMSLPPDVRALFGNSPEGMLDAYNAGEQREVFQRIGLLPPEPEVALPAEPGSKEPAAKTA